MNSENFLPKLPIFLGMMASGAGFLLLALFLLSGDYFLKQPAPQIYQQEPAVSPSTVDWEASEKNLCFRSGGRWLLFEDGCDDRCERVENPALVCSSQPFEGCDCGKKRCWNSQFQTCQPE